MRGLPFSAWRQGIAVLAVALAMAATGIPACAKPPSGGAPEQRTLPGPPAQLPRALPAERGKGLDFLFGALKAAPDQASAKHVESRIWAIWAATPSDTAALLMSRAQAALEQKNTTLALKLLDAVVRLRPDYIEGWNRRATLHYMNNEYAQALSDIREVLVREPRHFGALTGLGLIMQEFGDDRHALEAFRAALALNPYLDRVPELVRTLTEKVEGRDI